MNVVNIYLALASAAGLCLVIPGASTESISSYTKLTKAAIRVAKRLCHTELYKDTQLCKDYHQALAGFQTQLLSLYNNDGKTITGTGTGGSNASGNNKDSNSAKNKNNNSGNNKDSNSGTDKNNTDDDDSKAGYFGNPGISYSG